MNIPVSFIQIVQGIHEISR